MDAEVYSCISKQHLSNQKQPLGGIRVKCFGVPGAGAGAAISLDHTFKHTFFSFCRSVGGGRMKGLWISIT